MSALNIWHLVSMSTCKLESLIIICSLLLHQSRSAQFKERLPNENGIGLPWKSETAPNSRQFNDEALLEVEVPGGVSSSAYLKDLREPNIEEGRPRLRTEGRGLLGDSGMNSFC